MPPDQLRSVAARAAMALLLLAVAWWVVQRPWGAGFRAAGRALVAMVGVADRVTMEPVITERGAWRTEDTTVRVIDRDSASGVTFEISSLRLSYVPIAVVLALSLAASGLRGWGPGRRALLASAAGACAYAVLSLSVTVARAAIRAPSLDLQVPGPAALAIELVYRVLVNPPGFEYVVPAFIWFACTAIWGDPRPSMPTMPANARGARREKRPRRRR
jgi:hypothetical protein